MIQDNFNHFESLKTKGYSETQAYLEAKQQGLDSLAQIRMLRSVYHLSLPEAKSIMVAADHQSQDSNQNHAEVRKPHSDDLIAVLKLVEQSQPWEFSQESRGQWHWKSYSAAGGNFEMMTSMDSYSSLADCFAHAKANGYEGGMIAETDIDRIKKLFEHNQQCSPDEVVYEDGDWYNYHADEGCFETVDEDGNLFEIDGEGTLTSWGNSWQLANQEELLAYSHADRVTLNLPLNLAKELSIEATQVGLSLSDYVLHVLVARPMTARRPRDEARGRV